MPDFLHHGDGIGFFFGVHTEFNEVFKKLIGVGHVKITGDDQITMHPIVLTQKRMNSFYAIATKSSVTHMAKQQFTEIRNAFFLRIYVLAECGVFFKFIIDARINLPENILNGLGCVGANAADVAFSWRDVEFNASQTSAILAAVVLLLHHQIHFVDPVKRRSVFFLIKAKRLF